MLACYDERKIFTQLFYVCRQTEIILQRFAQLANQSMPKGSKEASYTKHR
jgi:hypothetical protein